MKQFGLLWGKARGRHKWRRVKKKVTDAVPRPQQLQDYDANDLISWECCSASTEQVMIQKSGALCVLLSC